MLGEMLYTLSLLFALCLHMRGSDKLKSNNQKFIYVHCFSALSLSICRTKRNGAEWSAVISFDFSVFVVAAIGFS